MKAKFKFYGMFFLAFYISFSNAQKKVIGSSQIIEMSFKNKNDLRKALLPVPKDAIFKMKGFYLWDPSVIKVNNTYHLFASRWPASTGMGGWKRSQVIRATSKSLFGPYQFEEVVLDPASHPWANEGVHNPKIIKVGDKFLLYYLGIPVWQTGFAIANAITGPWKIIDKPVIPTNNPAMMVRPNGTLYAVGKFKPKLTKDGKWDAYMNAFEATDLLGPYQLIGGETNRLPNNFELEDPTIWWANNQYNVICTDWEKKVTGIDKAIIYYTSKDGINYKLYSNIPICSTNEFIPLQGGDSLKVNKVERPQVFVNQNGALEALLMAAEPNTVDPSYIIIRPLKSFIPSNKN